MTAGSHVVRMNMRVYASLDLTRPDLVDMQDFTSRFVDLVLEDTITVGAAPSTCELGISSVPGGAEIFLNEASTGKFTPASGFVTWTLSPGVYRLALKLSGYDDAAELLTLAANTSTAKSYALVKIKPPEGYLKVLSNPPNLQIRLDNSVSDKFTPYTFTLPEGSYKTSVNFNGVWTQDRAAQIIGGQTYQVAFDFAAGGVTPEQFATMFINAVNNNMLEPLIPLARWLYDNDPTGFHWAIYEAPMETRWIAFKLALVIAGATWFVTFVGTSLISAGVASFVALCEKIGGAAANALAEALLGMSSLAAAFKDLLFNIGSAKLVQGGISLELIASLTKGTVIAFGLIATIIGTANFIAWADKEAIIESYTFNVQSLMNAERYEDALARLEQNRASYEAAVASLNLFGTVGVVAKGMWSDAAAGYLQRWNDLETICKQKLAEIPAGVGVGQSKIILSVDPSPFEIKWTYDTKTVTSPYEKIVLQGKYDIVLDAQGYAPKTLSVNFYERVNYPYDMVLNPAPEEPLPDEAVIDVAVYDNKTKISVDAYLYVDDVKQGYHSASFRIKLKAGAHALRVEEEKYVTKEQAVTITPSTTVPAQTIKIYIDPYAAGEPGSEFGVMIVNIYDSVLKTPKSAYLDVDYQRQPSHLASYTMELTDGDHWFTVEETGYIKKEVESSINAGETRTLDIYIVKEAAPPGITTGTLNVNIFRSDTGAAETAYLFINDVQQAGHSATYSLTLEQGGYSLKATELGFNDEVITANVNAGLTTNRSISLTPTEEAPPVTPPEEETQGVVSVTTVPSKARIYINEILQPYLSPQRYDIDAGTYVFKITKSGYEDKSETINVEAGKQYAKTYVLTEITVTPAQKGWKVNVKSTPSGGKILIDGDVTGKWTPDYLILNPGTYTIRVEKTGYYPAEQSITLEAF
jgi:hypothetical protein